MKVSKKEIYILKLREIYKTIYLLRCGKLINIWCGTLANDSRITAAKMTFLRRIINKARMDRGRTERDIKTLATVRGWKFLL